MREMIRRVCAVPLMVCVFSLAGCTTVQTARGPVTYMFVPLIGDAYDRDVYNREGTSFVNPRWSFDPDSHPAVRPASGAGANTSSSLQDRAHGQLVGGIAGALVGAQAGHRTAGVVAGSALGALVGARLADPCAPEVNQGSLLGALAGGVLGSLFGGGRGRDAFIALGAAGGAVRGTDMAADTRRCR